MKINFGTAIYTFLALFICFLIFVVIKSRSIDHTLVTDNYYDKDIHYQEQLDKSSRAKGADLVRLESTGDSLVIRFTLDQPAEGSVFFYRPSDKSLDFSVPISLNESQAMAWKKSDLVAGKWKIQVDWQTSGKAYYQEFDYFN